MKKIYISLPIKGHEDTYERRLNAAVRYVKSKFPEYDRIITPKEVAENLEKEYHPLEPKYKEYLLCDMIAIYDCDAIFMCKGWSNRSWSLAELAFAKAIGLEILYQP